MEHIAKRPAPSLDVRDLRVVLAVGSAGTTSMAASALHLSQPAVSRALLALEEKLATRLFHRTPRGLAATEAGKLLLMGAERILVDLGELEQRVRTPACAPTRLRVVCECYTAYHWLPSALAHLRSNLPQLDLSLLVEHTADPIAALEAGDIDAALLTTARVPKGRFEERSLFSDEVVFIVSATHPLAARKTITRTDLREHTLLTSSNVPVRESQWFMTRVFGSARPRLRFERLPLTEAILDVARAGMGIAVLSEWIASAHLAKGDLLVKRLASGPLHRPWRLAWRHGIDAAALRLRSALAATVPHLRRTG